MEVETRISEFHYCWLHDIYQHPSFLCKDLWRLSGVEAYVWAKIRRRCTICGHKEHTVCPYQNRLRCAVKGCGKNHATINCMMRKAKVFKEDLVDAKQAKILESLSTKIDLIVNNNREGSKLSTIDNKEKNLISLEEPLEDIIHDHSLENNHQNLNTPCYVFTTSIEQFDYKIEWDAAESDGSLSKSKINVVNCSIGALNESHNFKVSKRRKKHKSKSKNTIMTHFEGSKRRIFEKDEAIIAISKKLSKIVSSDTSKAFKNFQKSKKQRQCWIRYSKFKAKHDEKQEARTLKLSLKVPILFKKLRRYRAIHKLRHWKFKIRSKNTSHIKIC